MQYFMDINNYYIYVYRKYQCLVPIADKEKKFVIDLEKNEVITKKMKQPPRKPPKSSGYWEIDLWLYSTQKEINPAVVRCVPWHSL